MYDLIGDIHGHAAELISLLELLGYDRHRGYYSHPARKAVFVGDFIDRGPQIDLRSVKYWRWCGLWLTAAARWR